MASVLFTSMALCPLISLALTVFNPGNPAGEKNVISITSPPLPDQPSNAIKFIGTGHGHTGTQSLWHALKILGYHPAHGELFDGYCDTHPNTTLEHIWDGPTTSQNEDVRLETLLERGYDATTPDTPLDEIWLTLKHRYPDAPVVLTVHPRGVEGFVHSVTTRHSWNGHQYDAPPLKIAHDYEAKNEEIRQTCRMNNWTLLEFKPTDGWEPLCEYLGLPVPTSSYPHVNVYKNGCDPIAGARYLS